MDRQFASEGELIKYKLGAAWDNLHPEVQARFNKQPTPEQALYYDGIMLRMKASLIGLLVAWLVQPFTTGLQPFQAYNIPAKVKLFTRPNDANLYKQRFYLRPNKRPHEFTSYMQLSTDGALLECLSKFLGMHLEVSVHNGHLQFDCSRYFLKFGKHRLYLPLWLTPGCLCLTHFNEDAAYFRIQIDVTHPWFGRMFQHIGLFHEVGAA